MCVCFWDPCTQLFLFFFGLRDYFERFLCWLDLWLSCMLDCIHICVFHISKTILKSWLNTSSTPHRYLAICWVSQAFFLTQSRHLLDTWWIDQESSCLLDSSSTPGGSIELLFLDRISCFSILSRYLSCRRPFLNTYLNSFLNTSRYLICRALLKVRFLHPSQSVFHFFDLSRSVRTCSSPKHSLFHSQPLP